MLSVGVDTFLQCTYLSYNLSKRMIKIDHKSSHHQRDRFALGSLPIKLHNCMNVRMYLLRGVDGGIPPEQGRIRLTSIIDSITGGIPPEQGRNRLISIIDSITGGIPPEQGRIRLISIIDSITGGIPPEQGRIRLISIIDSITGGIPPEQGRIRLISIIDSITGGIPPEQDRTISAQNVSLSSYNAHFVQASFEKLTAAVAIFGA